ncbi:Angel homolog [Seminavis robusta]|uniref:Angel homolog n=1 Tax=Seminavis robusta TaxID=568900 RepID=A0A9N8EPB9_9STRA|nr:Angel homolog [Seminavis robusta]|eukprot:Sro1585_g284130.1 Angel homolog (695) ;mRNA; f:17628-19712
MIHVYVYYGYLHLLVICSILRVCSCLTQSLSPPARVFGGDINPIVGGVQVLPPCSPFRATQANELSVVSMNVLAPSYHYLSIANEEERLAAIIQDRHNRLPLAFAQAKNTNADVLCLQEVEGETQQEYLRSLLLPEYDCHVWSPLNKSKKYADIVGLCVAWKSQKHKLVHSENYNRGMIVQLQEIETSRTISIANLHLHARASAIERRLKTMATTIHKLQQLSSNDMMMMMLIAGDFNCDHHSITHKLLTTGRVSHGTLRDRNYKTRLSKDAAKTMKHSLQFQSVYDHNDNKLLRQLAAPITVSLTGRKPACMDHLLFSTATEPIMAQQHSSSILLPDKRKAKRLARRQKGKAKETLRLVQQQEEEQRSQENDDAPDHNNPNQIRVESVLATVNVANEKVVQTILDGLPNVEQGFPSDHLPIGALFTTVPRQQSTTTPSDTEQQNGMEIAKENRNLLLQQPGVKPAVLGPPPIIPQQQDHHRRHGGGGLSANARRRRQAHAISVQVRHRHNVILGQVAEWLSSTLQATQLIRDKPLYEWKWLVHHSANTKSQIKNKLRAPDLCCILGNATLVIVEVTVGKANKMGQLRRQKQAKYQDLAAILRQAIIIHDEQQQQQADLQVADRALVVILDDDGNVPEETMEDLQLLVQLSKKRNTDGVNDGTEDSNADMDDEAVKFAKHLQQVFSERDLRIVQ